MYQEHGNPGPSLGFESATVLFPELHEVAQRVYELEKYLEDSRIAMMKKI